MQVDWSLVIAKTDLKNKECVIAFLERAQVYSKKQLANLTGKYPRPWLCENSTHEVVAKLYAAHDQVSGEIPAVDDVIAEIEKADESEPHPLLEMNLPIDERHLSALIDADIVTGEDVVQYEGRLTDIPGIGEKTAEKYVDAVKTALDIKDIEKE